MRLEFTGTVNGGALKLHNKSVFDSLICQFNGKDVNIVIEKQKRKRSSPQNRYYHGVVIPAIQYGLMETQGEWMNKKEVHEFLKSNFNYKELVNKESGEVVKVPITTATLSTIEFEEYIDRIRIFADTFLNLIIPLPNEQANIF